MEKDVNRHLHCTKVLECKRIKHERSVNKFVAYKGCPAARQCPEFESPIYRIYKEVCEYWELKEEEVT